MPDDGPAPSGTDDLVRRDADPDEAISAALRSRWSRQRLLHVMLVAGLVVGSPSLALAVVEALDGATAFPTGRLAGSAGFLAAVAALVVVNRRGHTLFASWATCGILVLNGSWLFPLPELNTVLAMYATPILLGAFLIRPAAAFHLYGLSVADYVVAHTREVSPAAFNWLSLVVLGGVAVAAWLAARRSAWFEEAEEMYRSELDRVVTDLERLERRVSALTRQLDVQRPTGSVPVTSPWEPDGAAAAPQAADGVRYARAQEDGGQA